MHPDARGVTHAVNILRDNSKITTVHLRNERVGQSDWQYQYPAAKLLQ
jgi:hypothetical protein